MCWFKKRHRPRAAVITGIGTFIFDDNGWTTDPNSQVTISSIVNELDVRAIQKAEDLVRHIDYHVEIAKEYLRDHVQDMWDGKSSLTLEEISISGIMQDEFCLTFGVEDDSDFTVNVEFRDGKPCEIWGAD